MQKVNKQKVTWGDLHNATFSELKSKYRLNDQQLEQQVRSHLDGANAQERRDVYNKVWSKR